MDKKPNVLMICVDHWSGLVLQSIGHPDIVTPTLDQLADNGTLYTRAYASTPTCVRIGFDEAIIDEEGRHHLGLQSIEYECKPDRGMLAQRGWRL